MNKQQDPTYTSSLIIKFLSNELNEQETAEFELWLSADPKNRALVESFRDTPAVQQEINYINAIDTDSAWADVAKQIAHKERQRLGWGNLARYAAAAVLLITVGFGLYTYKNRQPVAAETTTAKNIKQDVMPGSSKATLQLADGSSIKLKGTALNLQDRPKGEKGDMILRVPKAGEYQMLLPDGTKIWLNAASTLKLPENFNKGSRRVELQGEAYFEVFHNEKLPFIVSFNNTEVKVLGTHFNVNTYGTASRTTLIQGSIEVTEGEKQRTIKPGQQAFTYDGHLTVRESDTYKSVAWKEGLFYFKEDRINDILDQIARWYDVDVVYTSEPNRKRYNGTIRRQATLSQVLEMLNTVSGTEFTIKDRTVTVNFNP